MVVNPPMSHADGPRTFGMRGRGLYDRCVITRDGPPAPSSNPIQSMPNASIETAGRPSNVVACGGRDGQLYGDRAVFAWLRLAVAAQ